MKVTTKISADGATVHDTDELCTILNNLLEIGYNRFTIEHVDESLVFEFYKGD